MTSHIRLYGHVSISLSGYDVAAYSRRVSVLAPSRCESPAKGHANTPIPFGP